MLTPITGMGNLKYHTCDTYTNMIAQKPGMHSALCKLNDGSWYEYRQFDDDMSGGAWQPYFSPSVKTSLLSATPVTIFNAISATPASPYSIVLEGTGIKEIKIITSGTSTSRTMTFKAKLNSGDTATSFMGVNFSNPTDSLAISTTGQDEIWLFSGFDGLYSLEFNVSAVAGGNFTVKAELMS